MHDDGFEGVALQILEHRLFRLATDFDGQNVGIKGLVLQALRHVFVGKSHRRGRLLTTV